MKPEEIYHQKKAGGIEAFYQVATVFNHFLHKEEWTSGTVHYVDRDGNHKKCFQAEHSVRNLKNTPSIKRYYEEFKCR